MEGIGETRSRENERQPRDGQRDAGASDGPANGSGSHLVSNGNISFIYMYIFFTSVYKFLHSDCYSVEEEGKLVSVSLYFSSRVTRFSSSG